MTKALTSTRLREIATSLDISFSRIYSEKREGGKRRFKLYAIYKLDTSKSLHRYVAVPPLKVKEFREQVTLEGGYDFQIILGDNANNGRTSLVVMANDDAESVEPEAKKVRKPAKKAAKTVSPLVATQADRSQKVYKAVIAARKGVETLDEMLTQSNQIVSAHERAIEKLESFISTPGAVSLWVHDKIREVISGLNDQINDVKEGW